MGCSSAVDVPQGCGLDAELGLWCADRGRIAHRNRFGGGRHPPVQALIGRTASLVVQQAEVQPRLQHRFLNGKLMLDTVVCFCTCTALCSY